ncbi:MAG TPA: AI-2E family transporter [Actinomycetota bacterium]|nr:AI-2E family transporter [Actinomycetota bacterium]
MTEPRNVPYRTILASIWLVVASAAGIALVYEWRALIFDLVLAAFVALVLNPAVKRLERTGMHRGPAILAVAAVSFLLFLGLIALIAAPITTQGVQFAQHAPAYLRQAQQGKGPLADFARKLHLEHQLSKAGPAISRILSKVPSQIIGVLRSAASTAFSVAIVAILAIFMLIEGPTLIAAFMAGIPESRRESTRLVGQTTSRVVSSYTLGVLALAILNGLITAAVLWVTGTPFISSLSVWAGLTDVLPIIGGLIGIVPAGLFAFAHNLVSGIIVVAVMFAYQQVKNHVLYPIAVGRAVRLNALLVMVAVLAGSELMGVAGAILAIPIAGTLNAIIVEFAPAPARAFLHHPELTQAPPPVAAAVEHAEEAEEAAEHPEEDPEEARVHAETSFWHRLRHPKREIGHE